MEAGNAGVEPSAAQPAVISAGVQVTRKPGVHTVGTQTNVQEVLQSDRHVVTRSDKSSQVDESDLPPSLDAQSSLSSSVHSKSTSDVDYTLEIGCR